MLVASGMFSVAFFCCLVVIECNLMESVVFCTGCVVAAQLWCAGWQDAAPLFPWRRFGEVSPLSLLLW